VVILKQLAILLLLGAAPTLALAQPSDSSRPWEITDNSFLVEEAFNQEARVFQNIFTWTRNTDGGWIAGFTQEWPAPSMRHQLSYSLTFSDSSGRDAFGATLINYRYQLWEESPGRPAFSPRVSLVVPTGPPDTIDDSPGLQFNLPFSKQRGDLYFHGNAGLTWLTGVPEVGSDNTVNLTTPTLAGSIIWRTWPMLNLMFESVVLFQEQVEESGTERITNVILNPGFRRGWNIGEQQVVLGFSVPLTFADGDNSTAFLIYASYELPF
jgi:hypothetical protein